MGIPARHRKVILDCQRHDFKRCRAVHGKLSAEVVAQAVEHDFLPAVVHAPVE
jgi:hypothetical protein